MANICALVMNAARARYFVLRDSGASPFEGGPELEEHKDLANPQATLPERNLYANLRGANRSHPGGPEHNYDDHREQHTEEITRRFVKESLAAAAELVQQEGARTLVVAANPTMLGELRPLLAGQRELSDKVVECSKDLTTHPPRSIHEALAAEGLMPARSDPSHTANGRLR